MHKERHLPINNVEECYRLRIHVNIELICTRNYCKRNEYFSESSEFIINRKRNEVQEGNEVKEIGLKFKKELFHVCCLDNVLVSFKVDNGEIVKVVIIGFVLHDLFCCLDHSKVFSSSSSVGVEFFQWLSEWLFKFVRIVVAL